MREFTKIAKSFWTSDIGRRLRCDPDAQRIALYLMTGPHEAVAGAFYSPIEYVAHNVGLPLDRASEAVRRLGEAGFCTYDETTERVTATGMAEYRIGARPNDLSDRTEQIRQRGRL